MSRRLALLAAFVALLAGCDEPVPQLRAVCNGQEHLVAARGWMVSAAGGCVTFFNSDPYGPDSLLCGCSSIEAVRLTPSPSVAQ